MIGEYRRRAERSNGSQRASRDDVAQEFRERAERVAAAPAARPGVARRAARRRDAGRRVCQASSRAVRVSARVGAGRRRDVGALHLHGHRAARGVEARRRRGAGLDAGPRLAQRTSPGRSARRSRSAAHGLPSRSSAGGRRVLERRGRLFRLRRRATHRATSRLRRRAASMCPTRCSSSPTRW